MAPQATPPRNPPAGKGKSNPKGSKSPKPAGGLNKKVGGLPVWAWGALVLGAVAIGLYFRSRSGGSQTVAQPETSGQDTGGVGGIGGGGNSADPTVGDPNDVFPLPGESTPVDPPGPEPPAAVANGFWWGGIFFNSQKAWEAWAKTHGINLQQWYANHPNAARAIGVTPPPPKPSSGHLAVKAQPKQSKPQAATQSTAHPVSVHPAAAILHPKPAQPKPNVIVKPGPAKPAPRKATPAKTTVRH